MGDILKFPSEQAQGLAFLDQQLRQLLETKGADEKLIDFAANQLTDIYSQLTQSEHYKFTVDLPEQLNSTESEDLYQQINTGLEGIRKENHALLVNLVAQLVLAEVRLFQLERSDP
jgi:hypothetical protein